MVTHTKKESYQCNLQHNYFYSFEKTRHVALFSNSPAHVVNFRNNSIGLENIRFYLPVLKINYNGINAEIFWFAAQM